MERRKVLCKERIYDESIHKYQFTEFITKGYFLGHSITSYWQDNMMYFDPMVLVEHEDGTIGTYTLDTVKFAEWQ